MVDRDYKVSDKAKIISILNGLQLSKAPLELALAGMEEVWKTTVLKVAPEAECFYLSTLGIPKIDGRLVDGESFDLEGRDRGILIKMHGLSVPQDDELRTTDILRISIPEMLEYIQKRESVRIELASAHVELVLQHDGVRQAGSMTNISYEGCGVTFPPDAAAKLPPAGTEVNLSIAFPDEEQSLDLVAGLCYWKTVGDSVTAGIQFHGLNLRTQNTIDKFVLNLQRNACRARRVAG